MPVVSIFWASISQEEETLHLASGFVTETITLERLERATRRRYISTRPTTLCRADVTGYGIWQNLLSCGAAASVWSRKETAGMEKAVSNTRDVCYGRN